MLGDFPRLLVPMHEPNRIPPPPDEAGTFAEQHNGMFRATMRDFREHCGGFIEYCEAIARGIKEAHRAMARQQITGGTIAHLPRAARS